MMTDYSITLDLSIAVFCVFFIAFIMVLSSGEG